MMLEIFTVFDSAAKAYLPPWNARTVEMALRSFRKACNEPGTFNEFPEDYTLFHIGSFNQETGELRYHGTPHSLGVAVTFVDRSEHGKQLSLIPEVNDGA